MILPSSRGEPQGSLPFGWQCCGGPLASRSGRPYDLMHDHHHVRRAARAGSSRRADARASINSRGSIVCSRPSCRRIVSTPKSWPRFRPSSCKPPQVRWARSMSWPSCPSRSRTNWSARAMPGDLAANLTFPHRALHAVSSNLGHARPAAGGARHGRRLGVVDRLLAVRARRGRSRARRSRVHGVFVRAVRRILERVRRGLRPRLPGRARRRH